MDANEVVRLNAAASNSYNQWWLAIFEEGPTYNRYWSNGWQTGTVSSFNSANSGGANTSSILNLSSEWNIDNSGLPSQPNHTYTVQFVVENSGCLNSTNWNVNNKSFYICPTGSNCKIGESNESIGIYPNPASNQVTLSGFDEEKHIGTLVTFTDVSGKVVKSQVLHDDELDIQDLSNGIYFVRGVHENAELFNTKLIVAH
jgi:Secretion system C-terminal sorting domain